MTRRTAVILAILAGFLSILALWLFSGGNKKRTSAAEANVRSAPSASQPESTSPAPVTSSIHDRKTRDQVRERIYKAWGESPPEPTGARRHAGTTGDRESSNATSPASPVNTGSKPPALDPQYIRSVIREDFAPMAKQCYESALADNPKLAGKLVVFFTIVGDEKVGGVVESAEISDGTTIEDPKLQQCFTESMMTLAFKPPAKGGKVTVKYPFTMEPDDPPDGGR